MSKPFSHFSAKVLADSVNEYGDRLFTMEVSYPRFIHAEAKTHRLIKIGSAEVEFLEETGFMDDPNLSRNASSSRAIPTARLIKQVRENPVEPIEWGRNRSGMQAKELLDSVEVMHARSFWHSAAAKAADCAEDLMKLGAHKQIVNRLLEPFLPIRVVASATQWSNFFALRCHPDAQPEIQYLANLMRDAQEASTPRLLKHGEWHLPYVTDVELAELGLEAAIKVSVARCARVSYNLHDGNTTTLDKDMELYERLVGHDPKHASPAEHQATPDEHTGASWVNGHLHGNFQGFIQYRKTLPNECL